MVKKYIAFLSTLSIFCGVALPEATKASQQTFTIALQGPLTGAEAIWGISQKNAVEFAISHFNHEFAGRYKVSLLEFDDQGSRETSQLIAPKIAANKKIIGLVGPLFSGAALFSLPYYNKSLLPIISPSANSLRLTEIGADGTVKNPVFHRVTGTWKTKANALIKNATETVSNPRIFIIQDENLSETDFIRYLKLAMTNGLGVGVVNVSNSLTDWTKIITQIKASRANVVISAGYFDVNLLKQFRTNGFTGIVASVDETLISSGKNLVSSLSSIPAGVSLTLSTAPLGAINVQFAEYFAKFTGDSSDWYTAETIDATNVFLYCISKGARTRSQMLNCVDTFEGTSIYGTQFSFDSDGDMNPSSFHSFNTDSGIGYFKTIYSSSHLTAQEVIEHFPWHPKSQTRNSNSQVERNGSIKRSLATNSTITCMKVKTSQGAWSLEVTAIKPECPLGYKKSNRNSVTFLTCRAQLALIGNQIFSSASYYKNSRDLWNDPNLLLTFIKTNKMSVSDAKNRFILEANKHIGDLESIWSKYDYAYRLLAQCKKIGEYPLWLKMGMDVISLKNNLAQDLIPLIKERNIKYLGEAISEIEKQKKSWNDPAIFQEQVDHFYTKYVTSMSDEMKRRGVI